MPLQIGDESDDRAVAQREVELLRVELRRLTGRVRFRERRGRVFLGLVGLTLAAFFGLANLVISPAEWTTDERLRFMQMAMLIFMILATMVVAGYFLRRFDRQRERARIGRLRQREILARLSQLDGITGYARRRRRRSRRPSWAWRIANPEPFSRPPLESMSHEELEDAAESLGSKLTEEQGLRVLAFVHVGIIVVITSAVGLGIDLWGPEYFRQLLEGKVEATYAPDPMLYWLMLVVVLVIVGGVGAHRVSELTRRARVYNDRLRAIERALWDARNLLREHREKV